MTVKSFMKALVPCLFPDACYSLFAVRCRFPYTLRRGQTTAEYLLMLAVVAGVAMIMGILFHKKILGGIFTLAGLIIGAGQPKEG